jgi:nucleoside-diphosphate-sugar epimerase
MTTGKILITGHKGYLGSVMTETMLRNKFRVSGINTNISSGKASGRIGLTEQCKDIREISADDLRGIYAVIHLAAIVSDAQSLSGPEATMDINLAATLRLAALARDAGVERFVFSSTCGVYGNTREGEIDTENSPVRPNSPYVASKLEAEKQLTDLANSSFTPVFLRNATAFGWSARNRFDTPINNFALQAVLSGRIKLLTDGLAWRPVVHVEDIAEAFALALQAPSRAVWNGIFNVGGDKLNFRLANIARTASQLAPGVTVETTPGKPAVSTYACGFGKIQDKLGFQPGWTLERGLADMVEKLRAGLGGDPSNYRKFLP